jgi:hypothetical protein
MSFPASTSCDFVNAPPAGQVLTQSCSVFFSFLFSLFQSLLLICHSSLPQDAFCSSMKVPVRSSNLLTRHWYQMFSTLNPVPTFPNYHGPLSVGTAEYEIPISEIPSSSNPPDANISSIKFRTFYPAQPTKRQDNSATWLPEPQKEWLEAYCAFLSAPPNISKFFSYVCLAQPLTSLSTCLTLSIDMSLFR